MASPIKYRFLRESDLARIHDTFLRAFADYEVPVDFPIEHTRRLLKRRGVCYEATVGAFDGDELVAVMATGLGPYQGVLSAYDIFTGVTPEYRGRGIAGAMFDFATPAVERLGARRFVLEVIQNNEAAIKAYERTGFETVRELACFLLPRREVGGGSSDTGTTIARLDRAMLGDMRSMWEWEPSWQNAIESVERSGEECVVLGAFLGGEPAGYAVVEVPTGDVPQLAVARENRRRGVGRALCAAAADVAGSGVEKVRFINIDTAATTDLAFYRALGCEELVSQYEMHRPV